MTTAGTEERTSVSAGRRLEHFPVSFFAVVMGLGGLGVAWHRAEALFGAAVAPSGYLLALNVVVFAILGAFYAAKLARHPHAVLAELGHPVKLNFFATLTMSFLLVAIQLGDRSEGVARWIWACGAASHLALTLYVMTAWLHQTKFEITHLNPAWFLPVVGNVIVPIAGVKFAPAEVSWFFFSVGLVFWLVLFTIVLYRLFFHAPLPVRLTPTLFILIAPPAVAFIAYHNLIGGVDNLARVLYYTSLFLTLLLASNAVRFLRTQFFLSAWAYTFPLAAVTIATLIMADRTSVAGFDWIGIALLAALTLVVAALAVRTVVAVLRGEVCIPEA